MMHLVCGSTGAGKTTYALKLCRELGAIHLSIDDWMVNLFAPDQPTQRSWPWIEERLKRCEDQILSTAIAAGRVGTSTVLDLGLQRCDQRRRVAARATESGQEVRLHFLDVAAADRWRRVERRNEDRGETFRLAVSRPMFDFIETIWQPPDADEMAALKGLRVTT
jgi:predicted kinase